MPRIHPKTWEDGVMPLDAFPDEHRQRIAAAILRATPPKRWLDFVGCRMESRAWHEWHWARGKLLRKIEGPNTKAIRKAIPTAVRGAIYARDSFACLHCGATENLSIDHIHPWSLGGTDDIENLQTLCRSCNSRKGARV